MIMPYPFPYFNAFTYGTPTIPDIYWNAYSYEERIKKLCMEYNKLVQFTNSLVDTLNSQYKTVEDMNDNLPELVANAVSGDPDIQSKVNETVNDYLKSITIANTYGELKNYGFATNKQIGA